MVSFQTIRGYVDNTAPAFLKSARTHYKDLSGIANRAFSSLKKGATKGCDRVYKFSKAVGNTLLQGAMIATAVSVSFYMAYQREKGSLSFSEFVKKFFGSR